MQHQHNTHTFWPLPQSRKQLHWLGAHAIAFSIVINVADKPAVTAGVGLLQDMGLLQCRTEHSHSKVTMQSMLLPMAHHPSSLPQVHWCQKNLLSSQRRVRLLEFVPATPTPPSPSRKTLSMVTKEKAWKQGRKWEIVQWREWGGGCK